MPILSVASPFTLHCYTFCIIERFPFIIHKFSPPLSFPLFYLAFHRFAETGLFLHLHGLILHPSIYYWQDQPDSPFSKLVLFENFRSALSTRFRRTFAPTDARQQSQRLSKTLFFPTSQYRISQYGFVLFTSFFACHPFSFTLSPYLNVSSSPNELPQSLSRFGGSCLFHAIGWLPNWRAKLAHRRFPVNCARVQQGVTHQPLR